MAPCFGYSTNNHRVICVLEWRKQANGILKFAGAETINKHEGVDVEDTISILKHTVPKYNDLRHPLLINMVDAEEIGGGFITVFDWFDGESCGYPQPEMCAKFKSLPAKEILRVFEGIVEFHVRVAERG